MNKEEKHGDPSISKLRKVGDVAESTSRSLMIMAVISTVLTVIVRLLTDFKVYKNKKKGGSHEVQ